MAEIKVSGFSSAALDYKIVYFDNQTNPTAAIQENVTGSPGRWFSITIDNKSGDKVYARLADASAPTLATTPSDWTFWVKANTVYKFEVPGGAPFSEGLNLWTTLNEAPLDNNPPAANGCTVTVVCS
tara:strand:+ start:14198 stop:14578 length:381 start_codon:yes stop_codon:yes gene_type:complete